MSSLKGKTAWVTGAGSGIGEAAAIALAHQGADIVLSGRRRAPLEAVAGPIPPNHPHPQVDMGGGFRYSLTAFEGVSLVVVFTTA